MRQNMHTLLFATMLIGSTALKSIETKDTKHHQSVDIAASGSLMRSEEVRHTATATDEQEDAGCEQMRIVDGNCCEGACMNTGSGAVQAAHLDEGSCQQAGFTNLKATGVYVDIFADETSNLPKYHKPFKMSPDCNPHYLIRGKFCENFCPHAVPQYIAFADSCGGVKKGLCMENNYTKLVGEKSFNAFSRV